MHNILDQFTVKSLFSIPFFSGYSVRFTNSALFMLLVAVVLIGFGLLARASVKYYRGEGSKIPLPNRMRIIAEMVYDLISTMLKEAAGEKSTPYFPFVLTLFLFTLTCNLIGLVPGAFTVTSDIVITFAMAIFIFFAVTTIGFIKHGIGYLRILLPKGTPVFLMPLLFFIELFAYLSRPVSLSLRLAANMVAGHIVLKVIASFVFLAGIGAIVPIALLTILTGFEVFIAILQAYLFTILSCSYLSDALNMH